MEVQFSEKRGHRNDASQAVNEEITFLCHVLKGLSTGPLVLTYQSVAPHYPGGSNYLFIHCLREQKQSESPVYCRAGIIHNFPALVSLDVDKDAGCA